MTEDLQFSQDDKDVSKSCVFAWPDRPFDSLPPDIPVGTLPPEYPYNPVDDWPWRAIIPTDDPDPIPGSTPTIVSEGFDIVSFDSSGFAVHFWFNKILVSGLCELSTQFHFTDLSPPFSNPPDTGHIYGLGTNSLDAAVGIQRPNGIVSAGFVNFNRLKQLYPSATGFIVDYFVGRVEGSSPEHCNYSVGCYTGTTLIEDNPGWFPTPPSDGVDGDARGNVALIFPDPPMEFRKVIKIVYTVSSSTAIIYTKNSPI